MTSQKIIVKPFKAGHEHESSWPPQCGTGGSGIYHFDKNTGRVVEGPPPQREVYDTAPYVIQDSIRPYYHPKACAWVDSRKALKDVDRACGTITTDKMLPADPSEQKRKNAERKKDLHEAMHKAVAQLESGTAPLTDEQKALCAIENERISHKYPNLDPYNCVGKKNDKRGKNYRKK